MYLCPDLIMNVFVVYTEVNYYKSEGRETVGVFENEETAKSVVERIKSNNNIHERFENVGYEVFIMNKEIT